MLMQISFMVRSGLRGLKFGAIALSVLAAIEVMVLPWSKTLAADRSELSRLQPFQDNPLGGLPPTARYRTPSELLAEAERMVLLGEIERALAAYEEVQKLNGFFGIGANSWNKLCWYGSLWGHAGDVIHACESAVELAPENINIIDSRGLARALTGDIDGAIDDFTTFVEGAENDFRKVQRQEWIDALKVGENPFTPDVMRLLFIE